jgi:hypothetical protein
MRAVRRWMSRTENGWTVSTRMGGLRREEAAEETDRHVLGRSESAGRVLTVYGRLRPFYRLGQSGKKKGGSRRVPTLLPPADKCLGPGT